MQVDEAGPKANRNEVDPPAGWSDLAGQPPNLGCLGLIERLEERLGSGDRSHLHRHPTASIYDDEVDLAPADADVPGLDHQAVGVQESGGQSLTEGPNPRAPAQTSISSTTTSPNVVTLAFLTNRFGRCASHTQASSISTVT